MGGWIYPDVGGWPHVPVLNPVGEVEIHFQYFCDKDDREKGTSPSTMGGEAMSSMVLFERVWDSIILWKNHIRILFKVSNK